MNIPDNSIFIPGNVPSMKNSKRIFTTKRTARKIVLHSAAVEAYLTTLGIASFRSAPRRKRFGKCTVTHPPGVDVLPGRINVFAQACGDAFSGQAYPLLLGMHFVRSTSGAFDYVNVAQIILDLLTAHGFIPDDNMKYVVPVFCDADMRPGREAWTKCAEMPGVILKIL